MTLLLLLLACAPEPLITCEDATWLVGCETTYCCLGDVCGFADDEAWYACDPECSATVVLPMLYEGCENR